MMKIYYSISFLLTINLFAYSINPEKKYQLLPDSFDLAYQDVFITTSDSSRVHAWILTTPKNVESINTTLVVSGSDAGNMGDCLFHAKALLNQGFTVILYDYRGFGSSSNFLIKPNMLYYDEFKFDLIAVINYVKLNFNHNKLGLYGMSMGTIINQLVVFDKAIKVDFLVADSPVISPVLFKERLKNIKKKIILYPKSSETFFSRSKENNIPSLYFIGIKDSFLKVDDFTALASKNSNLFIYNGGHLEAIDALTFNRKSYGDLFSSTIKFFALYTTASNN